MCASHVKSDVLRGDSRINYSRRLKHCVHVAWGKRTSKPRQQEPCNIALGKRAEVAMRDVRVHMEWSLGLEYDCRVARTGELRL